MYVISTRDLERLVQSTSRRRTGSPRSPSSVSPERACQPLVHGGPDPYLDRPIDARLRE